MTMKLVFLLVPVLLFSVVLAENILGFFPFGAKSHYLVFNVLMKELAQRGHSVVVVAPFEESKLIQNYESINIESKKEVIVGNLTFDEFHKPKLLIDLTFFIIEAEKNSALLKSEIFQNLVSRNISFDLIIFEIFTDDLFLFFAKKQWNVPMIGFSSCYPFSFIFEHFGVFENPSYMPNYFGGYSAKMNFYERLMNTWFHLQTDYFFKYRLAPRTEEMFEKIDDENKGYRSAISKYISLLLTNTHYTLLRPVPLPPQVVEVGGIHLQVPNPIPQELDRWMNDSPAGVVYFSFGSMLRGATLPADKVKSFIHVFGSLKQRVVWKWEDDSVDDLPDNVKIMKWLPQRDILGHPKTRVFISHGGLLGTTEAVVSGVPILGIPMYGDQPNNVAALVEKGVAIHVDYNNISVASLTYALNTLLTDKSYRENAKQLSQRFLDRPMSPLDTAVYWTEYVIRHRGAPHLRSAAVNMPWYQYYLLDVIGFCLVILTAAISIICYTVRSVLRLIMPSKITKLKSY